MESLIITNEISIHAPASKVWDILVNPEQTVKYMYGCRAESDWQVGSALNWTMQYEGKEIVAVKGIVENISPGRHLRYSVIDPNSGLEDVSENYLHVDYLLHEEGNQTLLTVTQGDFALVGNGQQRYQDSYNDGQGWEPFMVKIREIAEEDYVN